MKINLSDFYILLVSAGYDKKLFEQLIVSLNKSDSKLLIREFSHFKSSLDKLKLSISEINHCNEKIVSDVKGKIYNILIMECGLSINTSLALINESIRNTYPNRKVPIINAKKGFNSSINSLEKFFTESELLHIASKLRNKLAHGSKNDGDWMLKE